MNGTVLEIVDMRFEDGDHLLVEALVEDAVVVRRQTDLDPAELGPALCRGTMYFSDEQLIPPTDADFLRLLSDEVDDWELVDTSDVA